MTTLTPEEFARRFGDFISDTDTDRPITDEELDLLQEVDRLADGPLGQARLRQIVRQRPEILYPRTLSVEQVAEGLGVSPDYIRLLAVAGVLHGTLTPAGWMFSPSDVYAHVYPDESAT